MIWIFNQVTKWEYTQVWRKMQGVLASYNPNGATVYHVHVSYGNLGNMTKMHAGNHDILYDMIVVGIICCCS